MVTRLPLLGAVALLTSPALFAQHTISLHSGSIQYSTGTVLIDDQPFQKTITNAPVVKKGERLTTGADGIAEVLLTPGVFVRMVGNSSLRMDEVKLSDTRVAVLQGSLMVECAEMIKDNSVMFTLAGQTVEIRKPGLFRLEANPPSVSVIHGEVFVTGGLNATVTSGKQLPLDSAVASLQKSALSKDDLYQFSEARSADSAYASNVASNSLFSAGSSCMGSTWYWMSGVGMYSYIPCGSYVSPFGYPFFGMNYGYLYDGLPYYYAPPGLVLGGAGFGYGPSGIAQLPPSSPSGSAGHRPRPADALSTKLAASPAGASTSSTASGSFMRIPAFRDVLSTQPDEVSVSRTAYLARAGLTQPATGNEATLGAVPSAAPQNRFLGATSLSRESPAGSTKTSAFLFGRGSSSSSISSSHTATYTGGGSARALSSSGYAGGGSTYTNGLMGGGSTYSGGSTSYAPATSSVSIGHASSSSGSTGGHR
jgi:hypothetical protein